MEVVGELTVRRTFISVGALEKGARWNFCCGKDMGTKCFAGRFSISSQAAVDIASKDGELRVFIVAGEVSGDAIGSRFMNSLQKLSPLPIRYAGVGGLKQTIDAALLFRPHVVLTVDSKGFSFGFLKHLRAKYVQQGIVSPQHFHYVAPSFWAWKGGEARLKGLSEFVDHVLCIIPFEAEVCKMNGIATTFVGHPTLEEILEFKGKKTLGGWEIQGNGKDSRNEHGISSGSNVITLLPGSRLQEVTHMLPIFCSTMQLLKDSYLDLTTVVHVAPNQHVEEYIGTAVCKWPVPVIMIPGGSPSLKYNSFRAGQVALCTCGTVALELLLAKLPCAKVPYISLPNILLNSAMIPEALFRECTPPKLASLLTELIHNEHAREKQFAAAGKVVELLSPQKGLIDSSMQLETSLTIPDSSPSMIAAYTVLYSGIVKA